MKHSIYTICTYIIYMFKSEGKPFFKVETRIHISALNLFSFLSPPPHNHAHTHTHTHTHIWMQISRSAVLPALESRDSFLHVGWSLPWALWYVVLYGVCTLSCPKELSLALTSQHRTQLCREWPRQGRQPCGTKDGILWWFICLSSPSLGSVQWYGKRDTGSGVKGVCVYTHTYICQNLSNVAF